MVKDFAVCGTCTLTIFFNNIMYLHKYACCLHVQRVKVYKNVDCFFLILKWAKRLHKSNVIGVYDRYKNNFGGKFSLDVWK